MTERTLARRSIVASSGSPEASHASRGASIGAVAAGGDVAQNRVQPPTEVADLGAAGQCRIGVEERLLDDILRVAGGSQSPRLSQKLGAVALDEDGERSGVAVTGEAQQPCVRLRAEV